MHVMHARGSLKIHDAKNRHVGTIAQFCLAISLELRHISTIGKKLLNSNTSFTCPDNMVNFGLLTAEICWRVWGTPANFNGFRVFSALLHGPLVVGVSQTATLNRRRHLYSAGRPSRWALAHILVFCNLNELFSLVPVSYLAGKWHASNLDPIIMLIPKRRSIYIYHFCAH